MNRTTLRLLPIIFAGMFTYAGCAKQELVKKEEPLAPAGAKPAESTTNKPAVSAISQDKREVNSSPLRSDRRKKSALTADMRKALENIYFDFDSSTLSDTARQALSRNFETLKKNPPVKIRIEGHCDERGSDDYNLALGERRAQAAFRYLTSLGIPAGRLSTISYGNEKPADRGHDEAAWAKNRRDEFVIAK